MKKSNPTPSQGNPQDSYELDYFQPAQRPARDLNEQYPTSAHAVAPGPVRSSGHRPAAGAGTRRTSARRKKRLTVGQKWGIAGAIAGTFILVLGIIVYLVWRSLMGDINIVSPSEETLPSEYNVPTESLVNEVPIVKGITNILLLGVDNRDSVTVSVNERSDSMMILTIDTINNKIKLTSLQRDMAVYMPGSSAVNKLNAANSFGGPPMAMRVINDTFRLNIKQYVVVNMRGMEKIVDVAGGVTVDVSDAELQYVNKELRAINHVFSDTAASPLLSKSGVQKLNGRQAVTYARIRKLDSDYKRMERQREVLQALMTAFLKADLTTKSKMVSQGLGLITTNIPATEITNLGLKVLPMMSGTIEQLQIPIAGYFREYSGASWMNLCDFNGMIPQLQTFIWGKTFPFDRVKDIPGAPGSSIPLPTTHATTHATTKATTKATTTAATTTVTETTSAPTETSSQETTSETSFTLPSFTTKQTTKQTTTPPTTETPTTATTEAPADSSTTTGD